MRDFRGIKPKQNRRSARPTHMHLSRITFVLLAAAFIASGIRAQDSVTTMGEEIPGTRSFYIGQGVENPEALSGIWEAPDGRGGAVGIHMGLMTTVSDDPSALTLQSWLHLNLGVFHRRGSEMVFGEDGYFSDDPRGGSVKLENGHLQLQFISLRENLPSVDLDLVRQVDGCWRGRFHRDSFDSVVTLCRPTPGSEIKQSSVVGTWSSGYSCIHIAQTGAASFNGWSDPLQRPGNTSYYSTCNPDYHPPFPLLQVYGVLAKVQVTFDRSVTLELGAYSALCCSHLFTGKLSEDGTEITGNFPAGPNQYPHAATWRKIPEDTCVDSAALPKTPPDHVSHD